MAVVYNVLSKSNQLADSDNIKAADWIKDGSILDRRKDERRVLSGRRTDFQETDVESERRKADFKRRFSMDRRHQKIEFIKENKQELRYVEILTKGHYKVIGVVETLALSVQLKEFKSLDKYIRDFSSIIRAFSHREELIFYAYFDKIQGQKNPKINEMLMVLNLHVYKVGEEILEMLSKYENIEVDDAIIKLLVADLSKINELLIKSFKYKQEFLYVNYKQIPNF